MGIGGHFEGQAVLREHSCGMVYGLVGLAGQAVLRGVSRPVGVDHVAHQVVVVRRVRAGGRRVHHQRCVGVQARLQHTTEYTLQIMKRHVSSRAAGCIEEVCLPPCTGLGCLHGTLAALCMKACTAFQSLASSKPSFVSPAWLLCPAAD